MEPVFEHGQLRLYLLVVLAEGPSSGYDIIRGLQDRFGGLYSPSAGTVYPRLSKLEEEGLVERTTEGRRSTFTITDAGREELESRGDDVARLEERLATAHRRLADDMRDTVSSGAAQLRRHLDEAARLARAAADGAEKSRGNDPRDPSGSAGANDGRGGFAGFGAGASSGFAGFDPLTAFGQAVFGRRTDGAARNEWGDLARWLTYAASRGATPPAGGAGDAAHADAQATPPTDRTPAATKAPSMHESAADDDRGARPSERMSDTPADPPSRDGVDDLERDSDGRDGHDQRSSSSRQIPDAHQWTQIVTILRDAAGRIQDVLEEGPRRN